MISKTSKQIIAAGGTILVLALMYWGVLAPIRRSQMFVMATANLKTVQTLGEFLSLFEKPINVASPVGYDEIVAFYLPRIRGIIQENQDPDLIHPLVVEAARVSDPIIERGVGLNFSATLLVAGSVYEAAAIQLLDETYYYKAKEIFELGLQKSPNRLQFLQGMLDLARISGDEEQMKAVAQKILSIWPEEQSGIEALRDASK